MSNSSWSGARVGTDEDAPLGGSQQAETVYELEKWLTPGFASTADRDSALAGRVAAGFPAVDGMTCWVHNIGLQVLVGLVWTNDIVPIPANVGNLSLTGNYTVTGAPWGPARVLQLGKRMSLRGSVTNSVTPSAATAGVVYTIGNLPAGTFPTTPVATSVPWGDGVSVSGSAPLIVQTDGSVNFIAPNTFTTNLLHSLSLGVVADWIVGL